LGKKKVGRGRWSEEDSWQKNWTEKVVLRIFGNTEKSLFSVAINYNGRREGGAIKTTNSCVGGGGKEENLQKCGKKRGER